MTGIVRILVTAPLVLLALYGLTAFLIWSLQRQVIYPAPQGRIAVAAGFGEAGLRTSDGLALRAFHREANEGLPTIVYFHGNGGTLAGSMAANTLFAEAGYGLLLVNYRGYGGNPGNPSEEGFYRDGRAAMGWLARRGVSPADTILIGNSIGSGTATQMAREFEVRALILSAPFTSVPDVAATNMGWLPVQRLIKDRFDNAAKIATLDLPILVQHGTGDRVIPHGHGEKLAGLARRATLQLFDGFDHDQVFLPETQRARFDWVQALD